jgi:hypothetical protein
MNNWVNIDFRNKTRWIKGRTFSVNKNISNFVEIKMMRLESEMKMHCAHRLSACSSNRRGSSAD